MATNPMQRKAKNSFLLGFLLMLLISAIAVGFLLLQLVNAKKENEDMKDKQTSAFVLSKDVTSGTKLLPDMFNSVPTTTQAIPEDAIGPNELEDETVLRISLKKGTLLTKDMVTLSDEQYGDDLRLQEYNMFVLPSQIATDDYIDIRLRMPNGADYIVASKKKVEIPMIAGVDSQDSIWVKMKEDEILLVSNAIVESYLVSGSILYVTRYTEPGMQPPAKPTYLPNDEVIRLIQEDENIKQEAKNALFSRNNSANIRKTIRDDGISALVNAQEEGRDNVISKVEEELEKNKEERQKYLEDLGGY